MGRAGRLAGAGGGQRLLARLHGAGPGDEAEGAAADAPPGDLDHGVAAAEVARDELVRLQDRDDLLDPGLALELERRDDLAVVADRADDRDELAARGVGAGARLLDALDHVAHLLLGGALLHHDHHGLVRPWSALAGGRAGDERTRREEHRVLLRGPDGDPQAPGAPERGAVAHDHAVAQELLVDTGEPATGSESGRTRIKLARLGVKPHPVSARARSMRERSATTSRDAAVELGGVAQALQGRRLREGVGVEGLAHLVDGRHPRGRRPRRSPRAGRTARGPC